MLSAALSVVRLADLPDRPEEYRGQDRRGEAVEAVLAEIHHVAHAKNVGERRGGRKYEQRDPDPTSGRREQQSEDDDVENGADISVGNAERPCERRVGNAFASVAEDRAQQSTHQPALIEPDVDHGCRTDSRHTKCNEPENVHALKPGDRQGRLLARSVAGCISTDYRSLVPGAQPLRGGSLTRAKGYKSRENHLTTIRAVA